MAKKTGCSDKTGPSDSHIDAKAKRYNCHGLQIKKILFHLFCCFGFAVKSDFQLKKIILMANLAHFQRLLPAIRSLFLKNRSYPENDLNECMVLFRSFLQSFR